MILDMWYERAVADVVGAIDPSRLPERLDTEEEILAFATAMDIAGRGSRKFKSALSDLAGSDEADGERATHEGISRWEPKRTRCSRGCKRRSSGTP
jgi:hypothetical protein